MLDIKITKTTEPKAKPEKGAALGFGKIFTDLPGVSSVYNGTVVSYANQVKEKVLHVPSEVLEQHGAVSEETAALMAENAAKVLGCDCAISTTGIAGPDGGTPEKPVGLVYCGCFCQGKTTVIKLNLRGGREAASVFMNSLKLQYGI